MVSYILNLQFWDSYFGNYPDTISVAAFGWHKVWDQIKL